MKCKLCQVDKLSREFPPRSITDECVHPPYYCLRCLTSKVTKTWACPYKDCGKPVAKDSERLKECEETFEFLFPPMEAPAADLESQRATAASGAAAAGDATLRVTTLTGEAETFAFVGSMSVGELKTLIGQRMNVEPGRQRLVYLENELKLYGTDGKTVNTLAGCGVQPFSTIHLMVLLCAVPDTFNNVIFDLSWTFPATGRDFLDASCFLYMGNIEYSFVDWRERGDDEDQVFHSGDDMKEELGKGHQRLEARLKEIPKCVSHLVFVLSSFRSPSISKFPKPTLEFYEASDRNRSLEHCEVTYTHELNCEALIVCCVSRTRDNRWEIYKGGQKSAGNAKNYGPIEKTIEQLINTKVFPGVSLEAGKSRLGTMSLQQALLFHHNCENR